MAEDFYAALKSKGLYRGCAAYHDFRDLLGRADIDAVFMCVPDHWHGIVLTQAAQAGKDIYGEKPITRTIAEGWAVRDAVRRHGRVFQTGTQQRSDPNFRHACELARNGYLGKIHTIKVGVPGGRTYPTEAPSPVPAGFDYDMWTGPARLIPFDTKRCEWLAMYMISHYCAGFICNWGVHHLDIAQWGCPEVTSEPFELDGKGVFPEGGMTDTCISWQVEFRYKSGLRMSFSNSGRPNKEGCRFEGDQGWVRVDRSGIWSEPESLLRVQIKPDEIHLHTTPLLHTSPRTDAPYEHHTADFLRSVRTRQEPVSPLDSGLGASTLGNVADIMVRLGRKVQWDWATQRFINDDDANHMLSRPMRSPWTL
jgi:predicted dehydrogenase